jgi:hypothetical protein
MSDSHSVLRQHWGILLLLLRWPTLRIPVVDLRLRLDTNSASLVPIPEMFQFGYTDVIIG